MGWTHIAPPVAAAFFASLVECVEALTIVLAVGTVRGWRPALLGACSAALVLAVLVAVFGPALGLIPIGILQIVIGTLLLLFGLRWLRKAVLRAAGVIPLHDETAIYAKETSVLQRGESAGAPWDAIAIATSFKAVMLEGIEVVFIVIAVGATGNTLVPASLGAAGAAILVVLLGVALHRPLARVPENTLKFAVGVLLTAFGAFWLGEGLGLPWPGEDMSIPGLILVVLAAALLAVPISRRRSAMRAVG